MFDNILPNEKYIIEKKIGEGGYSTVYSALDTNTGQTVAIKETKKRNFHKNPKVYEYYKSEIEILKKIKSDNVIKFVDLFESDNSSFIVTEYCNNSTLADKLKEEGPFSEDKTIQFLIQILPGLKNIHSLNIIHRDIKLENIMLHKQNSKLTVKIIDLGFSKIIQTQLLAKTFIGTEMNMAPEILLEKEYGLEVDVYSLGVIVYQMLFGVYPYNQKKSKDRLEAIYKGEINFNYGGYVISEQMQDFIRQMLFSDQQKRIKWDKIYEHPVFNNIQQNPNQTFSRFFVENKDQAIQFYKSAIMSGSQSCSLILDGNKSEKIAIHNIINWNTNNSKQIQQKETHVTDNIIAKPCQKSQVEIMNTFQQTFCEYITQINNYNLVFQSIQWMENIPVCFRNLSLIYLQIKLAFFLAIRLKIALEKDDQIEILDLINYQNEYSLLLDMNNKVNEDVNKFLLLYRKGYIEIQQEMSKPENKMNPDLIDEIENVKELSQNFKEVYLQILKEEKQQVTQKITLMSSENLRYSFYQNQNNISQEELKMNCAQIQNNYFKSFILSYQFYNYDKNFSNKSYSSEQIKNDLNYSSQNVLQNKLKETLKFIQL